MKMDVEHLRAMSAECRARANSVADQVVRDEFLSLAEYYEIMAKEMGTQALRAAAPKRQEPPNAASGLSITLKTS